MRGEGESSAPPGSSPAACHIRFHDKNPAADGEAVNLSFAGSPVSEGPSQRQDQALEEGVVPRGADKIPAGDGDETSRRGQVMKELKHSNYCFREGEDFWILQGGGAMAKDV
jgi:hypothetical protein